MVTKKLSFDAYLGWVNITSPNNIPADARVIGADDLLRYEKFGQEATAKINEMATVASAEGIAGIVAEPGNPVTQALAGTFARAALVRDIRDFLLPGETLDTTAARSMSTIFQRAVDQLGAEYTTQAETFGKLGYQIYVPNGRYRFNKNLDWRSGVGIVGESNFGTIFFPYANYSFIDGSGKGETMPFVDCNFTRFAVDGKFQNANSYTTNVKGIFIQHMKRSTYESVIVRNTWATGFGVDHLQDTTFINCIADGNGRGISVHNENPKTTSGHSGFGIGTGGSDLEAVSIINCIAKNNGLYGIFTEKQTNQSKFPNGLRVIGCVSSGNYIGFKDCGSTGAIIQGNQFLNNTDAGVSLDSTILAPTAGKDGIISGNVISNNLVGVRIGKAYLGGYTITGNEIYGNTSHGLYIPAGARLGKRFKITDNNVHENLGDGIRIEAATEMLTLSRNEVWGNAGLDFAMLGSVTTKRAVITNNDFRDAKVQMEHDLPDVLMTGNLGLGQPANLRVTGDTGSISGVWEAPAGRAPEGYEAEYRQAGVGKWVPITLSSSTATSATVTGLTNGRRYELRVATIIAGIVSEYRVASAVAGKVYDTDNFNRPDTTSGLGVTPGGKIWGGTTWSISNHAAVSAADPDVAFLPIGAADRTVTTTFTRVPTQPLGVMIRAIDNNNWIGVVQSSSTGTWHIQKRQNSTYTVLLDTGIIPTSGDVVTLNAKGAVFTLTLNSLAPFTVTDSTFLTQQNFGLRGANMTTVSSVVISEP